MQKNTGGPKPGENQGKRWVSGDRGSHAVSGRRRKVEQQKADLRKMVDETLARLYKAQPLTKDSAMIKILLAGGGTGRVMQDNKTKKEAFMKMVEVQAGLGIGVKKFRLIWVFERQSDLDDFVNSGWEFGGQKYICPAKANDQRLLGRRPSLGGEGKKKKKKRVFQLFKCSFKQKGDSFILIMTK